jgi:uncharacterized protein YciI
MPSLCVIHLSYTVDLPEVEVHMDGHRDFLQRDYDERTFLISGRKEPLRASAI